MEARVDIEEIETTRSEKLLAFVLALFLLIGGVWMYVKIDDYAREAVGATPPRPSPVEQAALRRSQLAEARLGRAERERIRARDDLELRREAYRTALDARRPARDLEAAYRRAEARFERTEQERAAAERAVAAAEPAAAAVSRRLANEGERRRDRQELFAFTGRLAFVLLAIGFAYWLLVRLRRHGSRYPASRLSASPRCSRS